MKTPFSCSQLVARVQIDPVLEIKQLSIIKGGMMFWPAMLRECCIFNFSAIVMVILEKSVSCPESLYHSIGLPLIYQRCFAWKLAGLSEYDSGGATSAAQ